MALTTYIEQCTARLTQAARHVQKQKTSIIDDWTVFTTCLSLIQAAEEDGRLLEQSLTEAQTQCQSAVEAALSTIMAPVSSQLATIPNLPAWTSRPGTSAHLSSSFSPQEYITQVTRPQQLTGRTAGIQPELKIGQYLMTLPQHLEPLLVNHSPALNRALQEANTASTSSSTGRIVSESEISAADFLISSVCQNTCKLYTDAVMKIPDITASMVTQLTTDIDYVCNILEDLGVNSCDPLDQLNALLKAPADQYLKVAPGKNPRLIAGFGNNISRQSSVGWTGQRKVGAPGGVRVPSYRGPRWGQIARSHTTVPTQSHPKTSPKRRPRSQKAATKSPKIL
ncbi:Conserved oligomeric Golgi complex subunit 7 [Chionoecetes opilio]|uniref:Conserved oligomeric Golgi complex subunit 7 n=1 Tax=Chionoecetes opilio TaxID=41210 RepID=A0A8J4YHD8_CHIOP|nr:Conserved oligomeric Golgi complex subunit 7 [Chionoecetes opilio]